METGFFIRKTLPKFPKSTKSPELILALTLLRDELLKAAKIGLQTGGMPPRTVGPMTREQTKAAREAAERQNLLPPDAATVDPTVREQRLEGMRQRKALREKQDQAARNFLITNEEAGQTSDQTSQQATRNSLGLDLLIPRADQKNTAVAERAAQEARGAKEASQNAERGVVRLESNVEQIGEALNKLNEAVVELKQGNSITHRMLEVAQATQDRIKQLSVEIKQQVTVIGEQTTAIWGAVKDGRPQTALQLLISSEKLMFLLFFIVHPHAPLYSQGAMQAWMWFTITRRIMTQNFGVEANLSISNIIYTFTISPPALLAVTYQMLRLYNNEFITDPELFATHYPGIGYLGPIQLAHYVAKGLQSGITDPLGSVEAITESIITFFGKAPGVFAVLKGACRGSGQLSQDPGVYASCICNVFMMALKGLTTTTGAAGFLHQLTVVYQGEIAALIAIPTFLAYMYNRSGADDLRYQAELAKYTIQKAAHEQCMATSNFGSFYCGPPPIAPIPPVVVEDVPPEPTAAPTAAPTIPPTTAPPSPPTAPPSPPTAGPTAGPTAPPSPPTAGPTVVARPNPTPAAAPSSMPTATPTAAAAPSSMPTVAPTAAAAPSSMPTASATPAPEPTNFEFAPPYAPGQAPGNTTAIRGEQVLRARGAELARTRNAFARVARGPQAPPVPPSAYSGVNYEQARYDALAQAGIFGGAMETQQMLVMERVSLATEMSLKMTLETALLDYAMLSTLEDFSIGTYEIVPDIKKLYEVIITNGSGLMLTPGLIPDPTVSMDNMIAFKESTAFAIMDRGFTGGGRRNKRKSTRVRNISSLPTLKSKRFPKLKRRHTFRKGRRGKNTRKQRDVFN